MDGLFTLAIVVGAAVGVVLMLLIDTETLAKQLKEARQRAHEMTYRAHTAEAKVTDNNKRARELISQLTKVARQLDGLQEVNGRLREELQQKQTQLTELAKENDHICDRLTRTETDLKHTQQSLEAAKEWREQATHLREENEELETQLETAEAQMGQLRAQVNGTLQQLTETQSLRKQILQGEANLKAAQNEIANVQAQLKKVQNQLTFTRLEGKGDLTLIKGIGPAYAQRLKESGIKTLADLAKANPEHLQEVVQLKSWQNANTQAWIDEALELAAVFDQQA